MTRVPFIKFVFRGKRFDEAVMPVEALVELETYRALVVAVAEGLYRQENPERVRLPKGFAGSLRLVLASQESGSTVPHVERVLDRDTLPGLERVPDLFDRADELVRTAFEEAARNTRPSLSASLIPRMLGFGKTLRDDESVAIGSPSGPVVDRTVRRWLQREIGAPYEEPVELIGRVRAADRESGGFRIRTLDGLPIQVTSGTPLTLVLDSFAEDSLVRVRGTGLHSADGTLQRVIAAADISLAEEGDEGCAIPILEQAEGLKALAPGWYEGEGAALDPAATDRAAALLAALVEHDGLPVPYLYPKLDDDLQAEWSVAGWEISLAFDLDQWTAECIAIHLETDDLEETTFDLNAPGEELNLGRKLRRLLRGDR